jgi:hypothetical protein
LMRIIGAKREAPRMPIRTRAPLSAMGAMLAVDQGSLGQTSRAQALWLPGPHAVLFAGPDSDMLALRAKVVVLAAGALVTPVRLLNSRSGMWPRGLGNGPKRQPGERISVQAGIRSERPAAR